MSNKLFLFFIFNLLLGCSGNLEFAGIKDKTENSGIDAASEENGSLECISKTQISIQEKGSFSQNSKSALYSDIIRKGARSKKSFALIYKNEIILKLPKNHKAGTLYFSSIQEISPEVVSPASALLIQKDKKGGETLKEISFSQIEKKDLLENFEMSQKGPSKDFKRISIEIDKEIQVLYLLKGKIDEAVITIFDMEFSEEEECSCIDLKELKTGESAEGKEGFYAPEKHQGVTSKTVYYKISEKNVRIFIKRQGIVRLEIGQVVSKELKPVAMKFEVNDYNADEPFFSFGVSKEDSTLQLEQFTGIQSNESQIGVSKTLYKLDLIISTDTSYIDLHKSSGEKNHFILFRNPQFCLE